MSDEPKKPTMQELIDRFHDWQRGKIELKPGQAVVLTRELVEHFVDQPRTSETERKNTEKFIWEFLVRVTRPFFCNGVGYLLPSFSVGRIEGGVPFAVAKDDQHFSFLLTTLGIHPGSPMHDRVGKFIHNMCSHFGIKTQSRLAFHFEPQTFAVYAASRPGFLIKVTANSLSEIVNGDDNQLFLYPERFQSLLSKPLGEIMEHYPYDPISRSLVPDSFLVQHLFGGSCFELQNMNESQVRQLILAYVFFLMMPGIVSERAMLQCLGPSGSGKTFLLELLGHLLMGSNFSVRPMPVDLKEFENQLINEYFIVYDNISKVPLEIRDRFCQAVTGVEIVRRVLFTTSEEARYVSRSTIALSAITPPLPELEHQNRTITINFAERQEQGFIAKEELFKRVDRNRDDIIINLLRRMVLVLEALKAQSDYVPKVNVRLASVATFILRVSRNEGWEAEAEKLLAAWADDQTGYAIQEDDISTALTRWMARDSWKPNVELTATMLNARLLAEMTERPENLNWRGNHLALSKIISRNLKVYASRFGLERGPSTLRTSRGNHTYRFNPSSELLAEIREAASYERSATGLEPTPGYRDGAELAF